MLFTTDSQHPSYHVPEKEKAGSDVVVGDCWVTTKQTVGRFKKMKKPFQNAWKGFSKSGRKKEGKGNQGYV
jgi:hypothetical protein